MLEVGHVNGHEEDGEPENLTWVCRACNVEAGNTLRAAGFGRSTRQYNPSKSGGASSVGEWLQAVGAITPHIDRGHRGLVSDMPVSDAVATIRATPHSKRSQFAAELRSRRSQRRGNPGGTMKHNPEVDILYEAGEVAAEQRVRPEEALSQLVAVVPVQQEPEEVVAVFLEGYGERQNPAAFERCVKAVKAKGGAVSPYAVCSAAGKRNPLPIPGLYDISMLASVGDALRKKALGRRNAAKKRGFKGWLQSLGRSLRNPLDAASAMSEEFHGRPVDELIEVEETVHEHEYLAELGELVELRVKARDGGRVTLSKFEGALLCSNEEGTQLYIRGGDQGVDLAEFGISKPHDKEELGVCTQIKYHTVKDHLGDEGGDAVYYHKFAEDGGYYPTLIYSTRDKKLSFVGGSYTVRPEGITN